MTKVGIFVGSLRKGSYSRQIAEHVATLFPDEIQIEFVETENLPFYNPDFDDENRVPTSYTAFRNTMKEIDAVLFVTPEYNRSYPAVLKNALDVGSRPYGQSIWDGKPAAIISQSPGNISGFGANHHLRQPFVFLNMPTLQQPEAYIGHSAELLENGKIKDSGTVEFLQTFVNAFVDFINKSK